MKNTLNFDFLTLPEHIIEELENPDWKIGQRIHNWKYHVDIDFVKHWSALTIREKQIVAYFANQQAEQAYERD